jgi:hypothetical protein
VVLNWATRPHVVWFSRDMDALDLTYLRLFSNATELATLRHARLATRLMTSNASSNAGGSVSSGVRKRGDGDPSS